jgi:hypothetical protein
MHFALYIFIFGLPNVTVYGYRTYGDCAYAGEAEVARITRQKHLPNGAVYYKCFER